MSLDNLWTNKRKTRGQLKEEQEGRKSYFDNKIDGHTALKTWLQVSYTTENMDHSEDDIFGKHQDGNSIS